MAEIKTLVDDIYEYVQTGGGPTGPSTEAVEELGSRLSETIGGQLRQRAHTTQLRMSNLGTPCERKLWYSIHTPGDAEELPAPARIKFLFGHILEDLVLWLAEQSGHDVKGRQTECSIDGVLGHRDAVIDGHLVDVKSASTYSFKKFEANGLREADAFGYLTQLGAYLHSAKTDELVHSKDRASFVAIDKTLGKICVDTYKFPEYNYGRLVEKKRQMLRSPEPPNRGFSDIADGKSGNRKLATACSYCPFKQKCWPNLRTFLYASGPVFLTSVSRIPNVAEVTITDAVTEESDNYS